MVATTAHDELVHILTGHVNHCMLFHQNNLGSAGGTEAANVGRRAGEMAGLLIHRRDKRLGEETASETLLRIIHQQKMGCDCSSLRREFLAR